MSKTTPANRVRITHEGVVYLVPSIQARSRSIPLRRKDAPHPVMVPCDYVLKLTEEEVRAVWDLKADGHNNSFTALRAWATAVELAWQQVRGTKETSI